MRKNLFPFDILKAWVYGLSIRWSQTAVIPDRPISADSASLEPRAAGHRERQSRRLGPILRFQNI